MNIALKKICSLLLLMGLMAPVVEKSIHSWEHRNDVHCTSSDKHFHELEHNCAVCDYDQPVCEAASVFTGIHISSQAANYLNHYKLVFSVDRFVKSAPRAPPTVA